MNVPVGNGVINCWPEEYLAIYQLKSRYFRLLDTKAWDQFRKLFTDDMRFWVDRESVFPSDSPPVTVGGNEFVEHVSRLLESAVTVHHGHMPEIDLLDARSARGIWAMYDWVDDAACGRSFQGYGHYHEEYIKGSDERWRISRLRLTRIRVDEVRPTRPVGVRPWPEPWSCQSGVGAASPVAGRPRQSDD